METNSPKGSRKDVRLPSVDQQRKAPSRTTTAIFAGCSSGKLKELVGSLDAINIKLDEKIEMLHGKGYTTFMSGMTEGFDMMAAQAVIRAKAKYTDIRLVVVCAFVGQELSYNSSDRLWYKDILNAADDVVFTSETYHGRAFFVRSDYLLAKSNFLICFYDGAPGTIKYLVNRALKSHAVVNIREKNIL